MLQAFLKCQILLNLKLVETKVNFKPTKGFNAHKAIIRLRIAKYGTGSVENSGNDWSSSNSKPSGRIQKATEALLGTLNGTMNVEALASGKVACAALLGDSPTSSR